MCSVFRTGKGGGPVARGYNNNLRKVALNAALVTSDNDKIASTVC